MLSEQELLREGAKTGFQEPLEKVIRLTELLEALRSHPFLKPRIALKGGTALNLFVLDVHRLSVDIDLNYIGSVDRETMLQERPKMEQAVQAACSRLGLQVPVVSPPQSAPKIPPYPTLASPTCRPSPTTEPSPGAHASPGCG